MGSGKGSNVLLRRALALSQPVFYSVQKHRERTTTYKQQ